MMKNEPVTAPVKYFVGDLCYVMHDVWPEVCDLCVFDNSEWMYQLEDGRDFILFSTSYGDGEYFDRQGNSYGVDSGTIGAIRLDDIKDKEANLEAGVIHEFPLPLEEYDCAYDAGTLVFGTVEIDTAPDYEDEEDEEDLRGYEYEDEEGEDA